MKTLSLLLGLAVVATSALARPIHWNSDPRALNLASDDLRMSSDYRFELGVFRDGFVPTADNVDQWAAHWAPAQRVVYHEGNDWFAGRYVVTDNSAPFTANTPAWVWGFAGDSADGEWLLFRASNWRWPRANAMTPVALEWSAANANQVLIGDIGSGTAHQLRSASVRGLTAPATTYRQWLAETGAVPGRDSKIAFFSGGRGPLLSLQPRLGEAPGERPELQLNRLADRQGAVAIEYSTNLVDWHNANGRLEILQDTPTGLRFRTDETLAGESRLFFRTVLTE